MCSIWPGRGKGGADVYLSHTGGVDTWCDWPREGIDESIVSAGSEGIKQARCGSQSHVASVDVKAESKGERILHRPGGQIDLSIHFP